MNDNIMRTHVAMWPGCRSHCYVWQKHIFEHTSTVRYLYINAHRLEYNNELNLQFVTIMTNIHYDFILGTGSSTTNIIYAHSRCLIA